MGLFKGLFKKDIESIFSPVDGLVVPLKDVNDPTFAQEILGKGIAIIPSSGKIYAPVDGTIGSIFHTGHAFVIVSKDGAEILVHIGLDTVKLKGKHFEIFARDQQIVRKGDLIIKADLQAIKDDGYDITTPLIITNTSDYSDINLENIGQNVNHGTEILTLKKK